GHQHHASGGGHYGVPRGTDLLLLPASKSSEDPNHLRLLMISLQDVSVRFGQKPCIQGVSLELEETGAIALIGPNGAGKTTLLRAIAGLQEAEGKVVLDGAAVSGLSVKERAQKLTYLGNSEEVVFDFSALECVLMAVAAGRGF